MTTQKGTTQRVLWGVLIVGAVWVTVGAVVPAGIAAVWAKEPLAPSYGVSSWFSLEGFYSVFQRLLGLVMVAAMLAFPIGVWTRLARRHAIGKRLEAAPAAHGKYLPWGRGLRRHASIPARYGGLRPRKTRHRAREFREG